MVGCSVPVQALQRQHGLSPSGACSVPGRQPDRWRQCDGVSVTRDTLQAVRKLGEQGGQRWLARLGRASRG